jgi:CheY-like chemotaxis protein
MRRKCVLIVDDSRTAREILAKRLAAYDIDIVKLDSAANAIDYLYTNTPDAVFMDYEMPGMDGFQALRVIKSNPHTATIPVMMYTSKAGGLALGEARALGAIGVLPKQVGAQDLDVVVEQLHLLPEQVSLVETFHEQDEQHRGGVLQYPQHTSANVEYLNDARPKQERVEYPDEVYDESLFVLKRQTRIFQKDLLASEQRLMDLLSREFDKLREDFTAAQLHLQEQATPARWKQRLTLLGIMLVLLLSVMLWLQRGEMAKATQLSLLHEDLRSEFNQFRQTLSSLETIVASNRALSPGDGSSSSLSTSSRGEQPGMEFLHWAANRGTEFEYGENPYDDYRIVWLSDLVQQLAKVGFEGVISLQAHFGDFCLTRGETGTLILAKAQLPFDDCLFSSKTDDKGFAQVSYQTIGFANFVNSFAAEEGGPIEIFVDTDVRDDPLVPYPETYSVKTAGEWNRVAAQNQRIRVSLFQKMEL